MRGSIVKKENGYYIVYDVGQKWSEKRNGWVRHQKWEAAGTREKKAEKLLSERLNEVHRGEYRERKGTMFRDFADQWFEECIEAGDLKPSTGLFYRRNLDLHILPVFGGKKLLDLRLDDLQAFIASKRKDGSAASTVNGMVTTLTSVFKYAVRTGHLRENPASYIRRPKRQYREMDFLIPEEVRKFLRHIRPQSYALFLMAITAGLRRGELLAAKWGNVDWDRLQYNIRETMAMPRKKEGPTFLEPKSVESKRPVDLTPTTMEALRKHRSWQAEEKLQAGQEYNDKDLIFCQGDGRPLDPDNLVKRVFKTTLKKAGLRTCLRFHDLRHTCASLLIAQGESPKYIQRQMRHASITTTLNVYGHLMPEVHQRAGKKLDLALFGTSL